MERLIRLWEHRVEVAQRKPEDHVREVAAFGWWFESGRFDDDWALSQLEKTLDLSGGKIEPQLHAMQRLARLASTNPDVVIRCMRRLVNGDRMGWNITLWREDIARALEAVLRSESEEAGRVEVELINELGRRGFHDFRQVLKLRQ